MSEGAMFLADLYWSRTEAPKPEEHKQRAGEPNTSAVFKA